MTLQRSKLQASLVRFFTRPGLIYNGSQAERFWTNAYHAYASDAEDVSGESPNNLMPSKFSAPLNFFASRTATIWAQQMEAAFVAYWTGTAFDVGVIPPPVPPCPNVGGTTIFATEATSVVTLVTPGVMFSSILPAALRYDPGVTAQQKAAEFAAAMDVATRSAVFVLITGLDTTTVPMGGPLPITNTCVLQ
jgi:hypothetical protein